MKITDRDWELLQIIWDYMVVEDEMPASADAIVIGGSGMMTDSALRAAELYHAGVAPVIVASGFANPEFSASVTEAELLADVLIDQGVPPEAIKRDHAATNTGDNHYQLSQYLKRYWHICGQCYSDTQTIYDTSFSGDGTCPMASAPAEIIRDKLAYVAQRVSCVVCAILWFGGREDDLSHAR